MTVSTKLLYLTGVVEDGSDRDSVLPRSTATTVHVTAGESVVLRTRLYFSSGIAARLSAFPSWAAQLTVNCTVDPCQRLPDYHFAGAAVAGDVLGNAVDFTVLPGAFRGARPGRYYFDVRLESGGQRWEVVSPGAWLLEPALARP